MEPWTVTFRNQAEAANVARAMRALLFDPDITGPDPEKPTLKYFGWVDETLEDVQRLFSIAQAYGRPISITPPDNYQQLLRDSQIIRAKFSFESLWPSGLFSDLTLLINGESFRVHRAILASASDYFQALLTQMREARQDAIQLEETDPEIFGRLLDLIYLGLPAEEPLLLEVLVLAQRYQVRGINYEEAIGKIPEFNREEHPILIQLLNRIFPLGYPRSVIELLEILEVDPELLPPEVVQQLQQRNVEDEVRFMQLPLILNRRRETLNQWIPPTRPLPEEL